MEEKKQNEKNYALEIVAFVLFVLAAFAMSLFHDLNHEEAQAFLLAKDSTIGSLLFVLPHYQDVSPLYMILLAIVAKIGAPSTIALKVVSLPFSFAGAFFVIFKSPFKRWTRILIPFMFFLFYEYTVISSPYAILFAAFVCLAVFYKKRNEKPILYIVFLIVLGLCGIYGIVFALPLSLIRLYEFARKDQRNAERAQNKESEKKEEGQSRDNLEEGVSEHKMAKKSKGEIYGMIAVVAFLLHAIITLLPNADSYSKMFTDHSHPLRNLIYTLFILPGDAVITDVDFYGLLQNQSWRFVGVKPLSLSSYFASVAILTCLYFVSYKYNKRKYFIIPFLAFAITAALGMLYHYQIGVIIPFEIFLLWICFDEMGDIRRMPEWLTQLDSSNKNLLEKIARLVLYLCIGVSLIWSGFSCINDIKNDVWYARQLNAVLEGYQLTDYRIISDWNFLQYKKGILYVDNSSRLEDAGSVLGDLSETSRSEKEETAQKESNGNYVITYFVKQLNPEDYYQLPNDLNFADAIAYSKNGNNYFANLNNGDQGKNYKEYKYAEFGQAQAEALILGEKGYPDIIIGDPNIVGLMGLSAENVRYYLIYEIRVRTSYKLYSGYQSWQMFIRDDLYMSRDRWPFMDQNY